MNDKLLAAVSRRRLIASAGLALTGAAAAGAPALALAAAPDGRGKPRPAPVRPLAHAGIEAWTDQVGTRFRVHGETGVHVLELVEVRPLDEIARRGARRSRAFAAVFAPASGVLPAGGRTYPASHASGNLDIFFGPAGETLVAIFA